MVGGEGPIHAGGRGKGGGVKLAKSLDEVKERSGDIIGMMLKTPQTRRREEGTKVLIAMRTCTTRRERDGGVLRMSVLLDRGKGRNIIMYSPEGGMDIEEVAEEPRQDLPRGGGPPRGPAPLPMPEDAPATWASRARPARRW